MHGVDGICEELGSMGKHGETIQAYANQPITDAFNFDDQEDYMKLSYGQNVNQSVAGESIEAKVNLELIQDEEKAEVPKQGSDKDIMITDLDRTIMLGEDRDDEELLMEEPRLVNLKKEIKIDHSNFGVKSYNDN